MTRPLRRRSPWPTVHISLGFVMGVVVYLLATRYARVGTAEFLHGRRQDLYGIAISLDGTLLGFGLATLTVVLGYAQSPRFAVLRDGGWFAALFGVFTSALRAFAAGTAVAVAALLGDRDGHEQPLLLLLVAATTTTVVLRMAHLLLVLEKVVRILSTDPSRPAGG